MRLCAQTLNDLPAGIARPAYDFASRGIGIVHFGIGAFHRAHMAAYTDDAMAAAAGDWRILGLSLRSQSVADQMNPQDGLYTLIERTAGNSRVRAMAAVSAVHVASADVAQTANQIVPPQVKIVSFTVTEKGYCRAADGRLDLAQAEQGGFYPILTQAFRARRAAGGAGLTLLSCDNLSGNGAQLARLMQDYLAARAPDLVDWFLNECTCPATMVDRIVPATTDADRADIEALIGLRDEAAVVTEPFSQWVIEDNFAGPRPAWERHGVQMTADVQPFETAKLRMLNGAHSALAYLGLRRGHEFVHQAIADPALAPLIDRLMREEAATSLSPAPGQDLSAYADALIARFKNPALNHRLIQIAMDGSQKIPQRWLETLAVHQERGRPCPAILTAIGAWLCHSRGDNGVVDDPQAATLKALWDAVGQGGITQSLFGKGGAMASEWTPSDSDRATINAAMD